MIGHELRDSLERAGMKHPRVKALPGMPQKDLVRWVARCAVMVLPSRSEGLPRVLMEGGAAGKCRVATRIDGIPNVIEDGVDGLLVEKGNVDQLAAALERTMSDAALRQKLGSAARERIRREFSVEAYIERVDEMVMAVRAAWAK
jgi:glycosyltransferase involved in cell wall biosynthesis